MFQILCGKVRVSDPCYQPKTWCAGVLENVRTGNWEAKVVRKDEGSWGIRNMQLIAWHRDSGLHDCWELTDIDVGVDSGQAGLFDESEYQHYYKAQGETMGDYGDGTSFYDKCCQETLKGECWGEIFRMGVVSSSGFGDGSYNCYVAKNVAGEIVSIKLDFGLETLEEEEAAYIDNVGEGQDE